MDHELQFHSRCAYLGVCGFLKNLNPKIKSIIPHGALGLPVGERNYGGAGNHEVTCKNKRKAQHGTPVWDVLTIAHGCSRLSQKWDMKLRVQTT